MKKNPSVEEVMEVAQVGAIFTQRESDKQLSEIYRVTVLEKTANSINLHLPAKKYISPKYSDGSPRGRGVASTGWITYDAFHKTYDTNIT